MDVGFAGIVEALAAPSSRRDVLRLMAGLAGGGMLGAHAVRSAEAVAGLAAQRSPRPWRTIGDCSYQAWLQELRAYRSPVAAEIGRAWRAARPHTLLCLGMMYMESQYATDFSSRNPASNRNPLSHRSVSNPDWYYGGTPNGEFMRYPDWSTGIAAWKSRITDPEYKGGVYNDTVTVADLVHVYAPASDGNDELEYRRIVRTVINRVRDRQRAIEGG